jgi:hypothetical protein
VLSRYPFKGGRCWTDKKQNEYHKTDEKMEAMDATKKQQQMSLLFHFTAKKKRTTLAEGGGNSTPVVHAQTTTTAQPEKSQRKSCEGILLNAHERCRVIYCTLRGMLSHQRQKHQRTY